MARIHRLAGTAMSAITITTLTFASATALATPLESIWSGDLDAPPDRPRNTWEMDAFDNIWPLCGGSYDALGSLFECPAVAVGDTSTYSDRWTVNDTFGPRELSYQPVDWHRGIDFSAECGEPVFAIADGQVKRLKYDTSGTDDPSVAIRHCYDDIYPDDPDYTNDHDYGCFTTYYRHLAGIEVAMNEHVVQGQQIGWSGYSNVGDRIHDFADTNGYDPSVAEACAARLSGDYRHLHFEVLESSTIKYFWTYSGDAIHPLHALPYDDTSAGEITELIVRAPATGELAVEVEVEFPHGEVDMAGVDVDLYERSCWWWWTILTPLNQDGDLDPSGDRYFSNTEGSNPSSPTWFDFERWNWQWSHRGSSSPYDWATEDADCPHAGEHGSSYSSNYHLERDTAGESFNGVAVEPAHFNDDEPSWTVSFDFEHFSVPDDVSTDNACVRAQLYDIHGTEVATEEFNCSC